MNSHLLISPQISKTFDIFDLFDKYFGKISFRRNLTFLEETFPRSIAFFEYRKRSSQSKIRLYVAKVGHWAGNWQAEKQILRCASGSSRWNSKVRKFDKIPTWLHTASAKTFRIWALVPRLCSPMGTKSTLESIPFFFFFFFW